MDYILHVVTISAFYAMLAQGLNFFSGSTGLLSLVHAGFFGLGAYGWALATSNSIPMVIAPLIALSAVAVASLLVSFVAFRTRDDYFVIITLSVQMLFFDIFNNLSSFTGGPLGIGAIAQLGPLASIQGMTMFAVASALLTYLVLWRLHRSAWGQNLKAIRDDEIMMAALGKPVARIKTVTFVLSALIAGYVGILFAQYVTFIDPTSFTISESIFVLSIVIVGGLGNVHGSFLAAIALVSLPEVIRFVGLPGVADGNARQIIYGVALVAIMLFRSGPRNSRQLRSAP